MKTLKLMGGFTLLVCGVLLAEKIRDVIAHRQLMKDLERTKEEIKNDPRFWWVYDTETVEEA